MTTEEKPVTDTKAEGQVRTIAEKVFPPFTQFRQPTDRKNLDGTPEVAEVGELPRALALVANGMDAVDACEQVISERVASNARSIRARDGNPYPPMDTYLPAGERRKRALESIGETAPPENESKAEAELARLRAAADHREVAREAELARLREETERATAEKDAEIAALKKALDDATAPPAKPEKEQKP